MTKDKSVRCPSFASGSCRYTALECQYSHALNEEVGSSPKNAGNPFEFKPSYRGVKPNGMLSSKHAPTTTGHPKLLFADSLRPYFNIETPFVFPELPAPKRPSISRPVSYVGLADLAGIPWSVDALIFVLADIKSFSDIQNWMTRFPRDEVEEDLKTYESRASEGASPMYYAVTRTCPRSVDLLASYGVDLNTTSFKDIPVMAYGIMHNWIHLKNGTEVVRTLVSLGACVDGIPKDMRSNFLEPPAAVSIDSVMRTSKDLWCGSQYRLILSKALNLTMRYLLDIRSKQPSKNEKQMQIADHYQMQRLFTIPYHLVGQQHASAKILTALWGQLCTTEHVNKSRPLIFMFAGPSGHGKTELARNFGAMLNVKFCPIDSTKLRHEWDVFGSSAGFVNHGDGSQLNNFLAENSGQRSVVFMDEFCRSKTAVYNTLLEVLDTGRCHDRREVNKPVDCSKTIWIFATNLVDQQIIDFYDEWLDGKSAADREKAPYAVLQGAVMPVLRDKYKNLTGRLTNFIPFFPFTPEEAAVVAHKYILELGDNVKKDIDVRRANFRGHLHLEVVNDGKLCRKLAADSYFAGENRNSGARVIEKQVKDEPQRLLHEDWFRLPGPSKDATNDGPYQQFRVEVQKLGQNLEVVAVSGDGEISAPRELPKLPKPRASSKV